MPGPDRPRNAPYYDYAVRMWVAGELGLMVGVVGNPDATTGANVSAETPQQPAAGVQFARVVGVVTHVRIHAENMLQLLVENARADTAPSWLINFCAGMPLPVHQARGKLTPGDITVADGFTQAAARLHTACQGLTCDSVADPTVTAPAVVDKKVNVPIKLTAASTPRQITNGDLAADPWIGPVLTAILAALRPGAGISLRSLGQVDLQFHKAHHEKGH
jgi:hypothetical protein